MGAHVILISVKNKKATNTTIPMRIAENHGLEYGDPVTPNSGFMDHVRKNVRRTYEFIVANPDAVMESDAHGQLSADLVIFDDKEECGYRFDYSGF
jgi:hypothetical protein